MAGGTRANFSVGGIFNLAAHVARFHSLHPIQGFKHRFDAPKATRAKAGNF
jgi:hypothetical protein